MHKISSRDKQKQLSQQRTLTASFFLSRMCVFGGAPREPRCARLARRPACVVDFICYMSSCSYWCVRLWWGASRASLRSPRSATCFYCGLNMFCVFTLLLMCVSLVVLCHVMLCHDRLCQFMLCYVMLCCVMLWYVMICHAMVGYVMLRYSVL